MEYIPVKRGDGYRFYAIVNDVMRIVERGRSSYWLWIDTMAVEITQFVDRGIARLGDVYIDLREVIDPYPWLFAYTFTDPKSYADFIEPYVQDVRGKRVLHAFSGGKDSTAALLVLLELVNRLSIDLRVMYIHIPFIEPLDNVEFVEYVSRKLGIDVHIYEPPRHEVEYELRQHGLPVRGARICTYIKVAPIRFFSKLFGVDYIAYGDRVWEAGKRFARLFLRTIVGRRFVSKKLGFTVIAPLTLLDVVEMCRSRGFIHPLYLRGVQRVACMYCPYKPVYEFYVVSQRIEDPGAVEEFARCGWRKFYADKGIDFETYWRYHLWRFSPELAKAIAKAKNFCEKAIDRGLDVIRAEEVVHDIAYIWRERVEAPRIDLDAIARSLGRDVEQYRGEGILRYEE